MGLLKIRLLGTGPSQGVPSLGGPGGEGDWGACDPAEPRNRRTRSAALIEAGDGTRLLVDTGPDLRTQLLAARCDRLDAVLWTHTHADHIVGLDDLRILNRLMRRALPCYGTEATLAELRQRFDYVFREPTPGFYRPALTAHRVAPGETLRLGALEALLLDQDHQVMRSLGLRVGGFAYTTDVVRFPEESLAALEGLEVWVVACFQPGPHPIHADLAQIIAWQERLRPRRMILTHMSSSMDFGALRRSLPAGIEPGFDGMEIRLDG
jgi:phosphoribosyl 1,2-cyclic phosphate phosphodiesterase